MGKRKFVGSSVAREAGTSALFKVGSDVSTGIEENTPQKVAEELMFGDQKMWSVSGDHWFPCEKAEAKLLAGQYIPMYNENRGVFLVHKTTNLDELMKLPESKTTYVLTALEDFWRREKLFRKHGFLWKRGMLLWGPPGSGKTSTLQQVSQQVIDAGGVSVYCTSPNVTAEALRLLRRIEPKRQVVVMIEDIDAIIERFGEPDLLALLDGELQIDNVVFIATTNYPEELDKRFVNRPSRFDEVIYIGMPKAAARREYFKVKNARLLKDPDELEKWVRMTKGFSIAQLKEVVVSVECLERPIEEVVTRLTRMNEQAPNSMDTDDKMSIGFIPPPEEEDD